MRGDEASKSQSAGQEVKFGGLKVIQKFWFQNFACEFQTPKFDPQS